MSHFSTQTASDDRAFCEQICRSAIVLGYGLSEVVTRAGHGFVWRAPDGTLLLGPSKPDRSAALLAACNVLSDKFISNV